MTLNGAGKKPLIIIAIVAIATDRIINEILKSEAFNSEFLGLILGDWSSSCSMENLCIVEVLFSFIFLCNNEAILFQGRRKDS